MNGISDLMPDLTNIGLKKNKIVQYNSSIVQQSIRMTGMRQRCFYRGIGEH